jgi:hypothetical protein
LVARDIVDVMSAIDATVVVFSVFTRNYLPEMRLLNEGVCRHFPQARFVAYLADDPRGFFDPRQEAFEIVDARTIRVPTYRALAFSNGPTGLCCLLKSFAAQDVLSRLGAKTAIYMDGDVGLYGRPARMIELLERGASMVLTPHRLSKGQAHDCPSERGLLDYGTFNAGVFGVGATAETHEFLAWWGRTMLQSGNCTLRGTGYDQKWLNFAPVYLRDAAILRDPGYNVAAWNLNERVVQSDNAEGYTANGSALSMYHFSFYRMSEPDRPFPKTDPWHFTETDGLAKLCREYAGGLEKHGYKECRQWGSGWDRLSNGTAVTRTQRDFFMQRFLHRCTDEDDPFLAGNPAYGRGITSLYNVDSWPARFGRWTRSVRSGNAQGATLSVRP